MTEDSVIKYCLSPTIQLEGESGVTEAADDAQSLKIERLRNIDCIGDDFRLLVEPGSDDQSGALKVASQSGTQSGDLKVAHRNGYIASFTFNNLLFYDQILY